MSGIRINSNLPALQAQRRLAESSAQLGVSLERLASGMRINRASDDAAGLAIASALNSDARVFAQAIRNVNDGISVLRIAEGALRELTAISIRQLELAEQAANGSYSTVQRRALAGEADALTAEFNRITATAEFNGVRLFADGSLELRIQAGHGLEGSLAMTIGAELSHAAGDGTFNPAVSYSGGASPDGMTAADFNGDGNIDLHIANHAASSTMLLGNGNGTFGAPISTGGYAVATVSSDVNSDGLADLVSAGAGNGGSVLIGNGNGTFLARRILSGGNVRAVQVGDLDGDGILDVAGTDYDGAKLSFFHGNGDGTFAARTSFVTGTQGRGLTLNDFNNDGLLDAATSNDGNSYRSVLLSNGNGTFRAQITVATNNAGSSLASADLDRDGFADLVFAATSSTRILFGNGDGTFRMGPNLSPGGTCYYGLTITDFTGDGLLDIARSAVGSDTYLFYLGNGNGTFSAATSYTSLDNPQGLATGDFNNDGALDIATAGASNGALNVSLANVRTIADAPYLNLASQAAARSAIPTIEATLQSLSMELGAIGALESRLAVTLNTLSVARENYSSATARITDVDVAHESSALLRHTILRQASAAVLAQANQTPALALSLLT